MFVVSFARRLHPTCRGHWQPSRPASRSYESHSQPSDSWKLTLAGLYQPCVLPYHSPWRFLGVRVQKRPLSTAAAAAKSGRPQSTLGTRLERQKRGNPRFSARKKPASPLFLPLGQLPTWFLGRYLSKGFVLLPGVATLLDLVVVVPVRRIVAPCTQNAEKSCMLTILAYYMYTVQCTPIST